jgi:D-alanyl-D-alanine carboxypeptidase
VAKRAAFALATIVLAAVALLALMDSRAVGPTKIVRPRVVKPVRPAPPLSTYATKPAPAQVPFRPHIPLRGGMLFDVTTGQVLWERNAANALPIASLTKMMTALVVAAHTAPDTRVLITPDAVHFSGSGVGLLPPGKHVPAEPLLYGLLLPSGNDAAIALADHVAGTQPRFVALMNARADEMGLRCSHFNNVSGIVDQGNYSCASDLATMAHAILTNPRLARIVGSRDAVLPFPIKGGKLYLFNNNPLLLARYPGIDGVKTGYTQAAGQCLVATARRGNRWLGVVLLHSGNAGQQAKSLLDAGFAKAA